MKQRNYDTMEEKNKIAQKWLKKAIERHKRHMDGDEPTTGENGMVSQKLMMEEMKYAMTAMDGEEVKPSAWYNEHMNDDMGKDMKKMSARSNTPHIERRFFSSAVEERAASDGDGFDFGGMASSTASEYVLYEDENVRYLEEVAPGAFDAVLQDDVRVLFNHNDSHILGRTKSGTAKVWADGGGLRYAWKNDTGISYANDLAISIRRGDIDQSSFGFSSADANSTYVTTTLPDGRRQTKRTINKFDALWDVSPVTYPANPNTEANMRDMRSLFEAAEQRSNQRPPAEEAGWEADIFKKMADLNDKRRAMML